jgi:Plasmid encoded RepA protein
MGNIHQLITDRGIDEARSLAATKAERRAVEAAAAVLSEEVSRLGITHAGFAMTSLPHRRVEDSLWERKGHLTTLLVESGLDRQRQPIGVPYGSLARIILLYLQTEAIRTGNPEVVLGRSMNAWLTKMAITSGGRTRELVAEQARRISACRLTFFTERGPAEYRQNGAFVRDAIRLSGLMDEAQPSLWQDRVRLDEGFWISLRAHPVPVREEAISAIGTRSMAIDVYIWLAYRLHALSGPITVTWQAVFSQFGAGFQFLRHFKPRFTESLKIALAVYPEARVDVTAEGLILRPSAPAVPRAEAIRLRLT